MIRRNKIISKLLMALLMVGGTFVINCESVSAEGFSDIQNHWAKQSIEQLVQKGGIKGYEDGTFRPEGTITGAEFLSIVMNSLCGSEVKATSVERKTGEHWAQPVMTLAYSKGIVKESELGKQDWDSAINRNKMAVILSRADEILLGNATGNNGSDGYKYIADYTVLSSYYKNYIEKCYVSGLLSGDEQGRFNGFKNMTRAEASVTVVRLMNVDSRLQPKEVVQNEKDVAGEVATGADLSSMGLVEVQNDGKYKGAYSNYDKYYEITAQDAKSLFEIKVKNDELHHGFSMRNNVGVGKIGGKVAVITKERYALFPEEYAKSDYKELLDRGLSCYSFNSTTKPNVTKVYLEAKQDDGASVLITIYGDPFS